MSLHALIDLHIRAPPESTWDPEQDPWAPCRTKFLVESGSVVILRPDDIIEIGLCTLEFQRDSSQPVGEVYDVQVKSSGHTGLILDTDDEEEQVVKSETKDLCLNLNQTLSTPDMQLDGFIAKMETIMETPAASRHQKAAMKTDPVLVRAHENILRVQDESLKNGELFSETRVVAESFDDGITSVDGSAVRKAPELDNESLPNGVVADATGIISDFSADPREILPIRLDQTEDDSHKSSVVCVGQSLQTPLESQEHTLNLPPSIPISTPHINGHNVFEASDGNPMQNPFETRLSDIHQVPEVSSKNRKRKRQKEDNDVHTMKIDFQVQIPTNKHAAAYKTPNKRQRPDSAAISSSSMQDSTRVLTSESPRNSDKPSPLVRSKLSSGVDPATPLSSTGTAMKIMFARSSSVYQNSKLTKFLTSKGVSKLKSIKDCDILCVSSGQLKKTSNLVLAVLYGKQIITDEWARVSYTRGHLQDIHHYFARDLEREAEWGINLNEAIQRGKNNIKPLAGHIVYFTDSAKKELGSSGFSEIKEIALLAGSKAVRVGSSQKIATDIKNQKRQEDDSVMVIVASSSSQNHGEKDVDRDLCDLRKEEGGFVGLFSKDIITLSALRGVLDTTSDEFVVSVLKKVA